MARRDFAAVPAASADLGFWSRSQDMRRKPDIGQSALGPSARTAWSPAPRYPDGT